MPVISKPVLISIVGPTAVGKTAAAIEIARRLETEIISCDSRQFFSEMNIGTAKPTSAELSQVRHHLIGHLSIHDTYNAGMFERDAMKLLGELFNDFQLVVMVGGSGLYCHAVWQGIDEMPEVNEVIREELNQTFREKGIDPLQKELEQKDPDYYKVVDQMNHVRLIRALEVIRSTGEPYSSYRKSSQAYQERPFDNLVIGLEMDRDKLYKRIDDRMEQMIDEGLFEEAGQLYPHRALNALQTVGYREIFEYMDGKYDREEAIRLLKRNSRHYAKRQLTWFKKNQSIQWIDMTNPQEGLKSVLKLISD